MPPDVECRHPAVGVRPPLALVEPVEPHSNSSVADSRPTSLGILPAAWKTRRHSRLTVQLWPAADVRPLSGPASTTFTYRYSG